MHIIVNGQPRECKAPFSLLALAESLELNPRQVAIERNLEIIPRSQYGDTWLSDGDHIEIVSFIGGG
jgi:thiamine biosynthesis protein ThiS